MIPDPTPTDLAQDAEREYGTCWGDAPTMLDLRLWIRRAVHAEREVAAIRALLLAPDDLTDCTQAAVKLVKELLAEHDQRAEFLQRAEAERDGLRAERDRLLDVEKTCRTIVDASEFGLSEPVPASPPDDATASPGGAGPGG